MKFENIFKKTPPTENNSEKAVTDKEKEPSPFVDKLEAAEDLAKIEISDDEVVIFKSEIDQSLDNEAIRKKVENKLIEEIKDIIRQDIIKEGEKSAAEIEAEVEKRMNDPWQVANARTNWAIKKVREKL